MEEPSNISDLVAEFAAITDASPIVAEHYLSACNYDLNRAIEFYLEHPPAPNQSGPGGPRGASENAAEAMAGYPGLAGEGMAGGPVGAAVDEDEELQRALAESMADAEPGARSGAAGLRPPAGAGGPAASRPGAGVPGRRHPAAEVVDVDEDEEELPDADGLLEAMARQREASQAAEREARARMEETMDRMLAGVAGRPPGTVNPPRNYPATAGVPLPFGGLPSMFPGVGATGIFPPGGGGGAAAQRRRAEVRRPGEGSGGSGAGGGGSAGAAAGRGQDAWEEELELPEGMSRHELEEARMMEAAMLGVPYEGRLSDFASGRGVGTGAYGSEADVAPEVLEHRELRWDQDRAYEESLAADRAKEQAAARAKAEEEARERAQREAEEAAARAAAAEAARVAALVSAKTARLPAEPSSSTPDAITVMVRLPDGSRHSRRFARTDRLSSLFDFVDVELDSAAKAAAAAAPAGSETAGGAAHAQSALKPGTYHLVTQFPRRVFVEAESGGKTFEEAGLAGGGGAAFFIEQTGSSS